MSNCQGCGSKEIVYSWPWTDKTPMNEMCGKCIPDFPTYYNFMYRVINKTLADLGKPTLSVQEFIEAFPVEKKIKCICADVGSTLCSSPQCMNRKGKK